MKKILPLLVLPLALAGCTAAPASSASTTGNTAALEVTVDLAAYAPAADADLVASEPLFYLDADRETPVDRSQMSCSGSQVTYTLTVPAGTADLYVTPMLLELREEGTDQSIPAREGTDTGAFRVERITPEAGEDGEVVVAIDPASEAFPEDLTLQIDGMIYTGGFTRHWEWDEKGESKIREWSASFPVPGTVAEARQALETATLHWSGLCRYVTPENLTYTAPGVTVHSVTDEG